MKNMNIEARIEALYQNQRTNKFIKHLIKAFCNTNYLKFDVMGEDCITKEYGETCVKSMLSDKVLDKDTYNALIKMIEKHLKDDDRTIQLIVEYIKRDYMFYKLCALHNVNDEEKNYDNLTHDQQVGLCNICHLRLNALKDGRAKKAFDILTGQHKVMLIPKIKIDTPLLVNRMVRPDIINPLKEVVSTNTKNRMYNMVRKNRKNRENG